jgi:uncharacterized protein YndB with AHSA1/START domain
MIRRQIVMSVSPARLWEALTDPAELAQWFGAEVEWDLREGATARFRSPDGTERRGRIEVVRPGRHLRFRWWPAEGVSAGPSPAEHTPTADPLAPRADRPAPGAAPEDAVESEVSYLLEPVDEGTRTRLTVQEKEIPRDSQITGWFGHEAVDTPARPPTGRPDTAWSAWDARLFGAWAGCCASVPTGPGARA